MLDQRKELELGLCLNGLLAGCRRLASARCAESIWHEECDAFLDVVGCEAGFKHRGYKGHELKAVALDLL